MASINDKFIKTSVVEPTRLREPLSSSATTLTVESTAGWNGDTAILAVIDRVDSAGNLTPDKMEIVIGTMNAGGLEQLRRGVGGRAQVHSSGAVVELSIAGSEQWNRAMDALISAFGQDGKIKESAFASGSQVVDGSVIKDGSIEPVKLKDLPLKIVKINIQLKPFSEESFSSFNGITKDQYVSVVKTGNYVPDARKYMWFVANDNNWQMIQKIVSTYADGLVIRTWRMDNLTSQISLGLGSHRPNIQILGIQIEK